jgi:hypothetical protein
VYTPTATYAGGVGVFTSTAVYDSGLWNQLRSGVALGDAEHAFSVTKQGTSLRLDATDAGASGEVRLAAESIHVDDGRLFANKLSILAASSIGFSGQTIDLNAGVMQSGACVLEPSPGPNSQEVPTETISINNERVAPDWIIFANVVRQCGPKTGVTVIEVRPGVGSVEFVVANFGSRACSGGDISKAETYLVNFFLLSPCVGFGLPDEAGNCP